MCLSTSTFVEPARRTLLCTSTFVDCARTRAQYTSTLLPFARTKTHYTSTLASSARTKAVERHSAVVFRTFSRRYPPSQHQKVTFQRVDSIPVPVSLPEEPPCPTEVLPPSHISTSR